MVVEAFEHSPELKVIDKAIEIQERISTAATGQFYLPTFGLQGQVSNVFHRSGVGSTVEPVEIPGMEGFQFGNTPPDLTWSVGLNLRLPLFEGLGRFAEVEQASIEIKKLQLEKSSLKNKIEQTVRSALHRSGASYAGMLQARISAESSLKNLDIVINLYSQGLASITELVDAQNTALIAELLATSAQFNFLIDMMNVQRAIGEFIYTYSVEDQDDFMKRLNDYYENNSNN
jgi:outer membrane protein TolC